MTATRATVEAASEQLALELDQIEDAQPGSYEDVVAARLATFLEHPDGVGIPF